MPYDANIERSEFIMRDYDRRDYREDYDYRERDRPQRRPDPVERLAAVVNDPDIIIDPKMVKIINDPSLVMDRNGDVMKRTSPMQRSSFSLYPPNQDQKNQEENQNRQDDVLVSETSECQGEIKEREIPKGLGSIENHDLCSQTLS